MQVNLYTVAQAAKILGKSVGSIHRVSRSLGIGTRLQPSQAIIFTDDDMDRLKNFFASARPGRRKKVASS